MKHPVCTPWEAHHAYWGILMISIPMLFTPIKSPIGLTITTFFVSFLFFILVFHYSIKETAYLITNLLIISILFLTILLTAISSGNWPIITFVVLGILTYVDDYYQHFRQWEEPEYHSPLHVFVYQTLKINKIQWIKDFTNWVDKLFGKKGA